MNIFCLPNRRNDLCRAFCFHHSSMVYTPRLYRRLCSSYRAEIVVGPWLVNTGSEVGPAGLPPPPLELPSTGCAKLRRRPAAGDVGAEPAPDRLPAAAAKLEGGTTQDNRSRGLGEARLADESRRRPCWTLPSGEMSGLAAGGGERAKTGTAEKCSRGIRIRPEHLAHTWRQQRAHRTPQLNRVKRVRMQRKQT